MSRLHVRKPRLAAVVAVAGTIAAIAAPAASAGTPVGPGGCNMLAASASGLDHMMSGSQNGDGAAQMFEMLLTFYPQAPFCGL